MRNRVDYLFIAGLVILASCFYGGVLNAGVVLLGGLFGVFISARNLASYNGKLIWLASLAIASLLVIVSGAAVLG